MGMAASQARLLSLQARQSNLEYQGQQINQERSILSQQCTALYNSLLAMQVPTPPSTSDFTTIQYAGIDNATTFTLGKVIPTGDTYTVEMKYKKTGHFLDEKGSAAVTTVPQYITKGTVEQKTPTTTKGYTCPDNPIGTSTPNTGDQLMKKAGESDSTNLYELKDGKFVSIASKSDATNPNNVYVLETYNSANTYAQNSTYNMTGKTEETWTTGGYTKSEVLSFYIDNGNGQKATKITEDNLSSYFEQLSDGTYGLKEDVEATFFTNSGKSDATSDTNENALNPDFGSYEYYVADKPCMNLDTALEEGRISNASFENYIEAIKASHPEYADKDVKDITADFMVYFTKSDSGLEIPHFVSTFDLTSNQTAANGNKYVITSDYSANGSYTASTKEEGCQLTFDTSGRITEIKIPTARDSQGVAVSWKTVPLEAETITDNAAYQDAYNKYEYAQYEYDKKQQEINAKTEIIQQQDRNLELKLQRLDNERTQITTEIEAVEKVVGDNIESTYKTFSG